MTCTTINPKELKLGDVLFFTTNGSIQDVFIHLVSPRYTHVAIYIGNGYIIEANIHGISETPLNPELIKLAYVYRIKDADPGRIENMISLARDHVGEPYDIPGAALSGLLRLLGLRTLAYNLDPNWFCSEFISYIIQSPQGYGAREFFKGQSPFDILPDDMKQEPNLIYKGELQGSF